MTFILLSTALGNILIWDGLLGGSVAFKLNFEITDSVKDIYLIISILSVIIRSLRVKIGCYLFSLAICLFIILSMKRSLKTLMANQESHLLGEIK